MKKTTKIIIRIIIFLLFAYFIVIYFTKENDQPVDKGTPGDPQVEDPIDEEPDVSDNGEYLNKITYTVNVDKEIEKVIVEYMNLYYKQMKELKEYDMSYLFNNDEQSYLNKTAISLLIDIRKLKENDLTLNHVAYDLNFTSVSNENNEIAVTVLESNYLRFNFMKDIESKVYNIKNEFTFKKVGNEYKIIKYNKVQDFFVMITDKYNNDSDYKVKLDKIKNDYITLTSQKVASLKKDYNDYLNKGIVGKSCDNSFDRSKALDYAKKWVNKRNSEWHTYDANCQNYVSQVLYAGGIPMDYKGSAKNYLQWKADGSYNERENEKGLVYTWTYVPYFYEYAKNNTGYGLCATVDENLYYAEAGDPILVGSINFLRHALISVGAYKKNDKVVDILVNSNTVDLENYPMSAYVYPYASLVKVYGWNNE